VRERALAAALHLSALALLAHLAYGVLHHGMDLDEFQFLHQGWLVAQGQRQYVDFWDDHGPLLPQLCSIFYRLGGSGDASALFVHRGLLFGAILASAALVRASALRIRPGDAVFAGLALALYAASPILAHKGLEVRSDSLLQPLAALALFLWLRAAAAGSVRGFALAGLALGAGFWVTQKTMLLGVSFGAAFAVRAVAERRIAWRELAAFAATSLGGLALLVLAQAAAGSLDAFLGAYAGDSFRRRFPQAAFWMTLRLEAPLASALALLAAGVVIVQIARRRAPPAIACVAAVGATHLALYLTVLPTQFSHSLLPAVPAVALTIAWALNAALAGERRPIALARAVALVAAVCAVGAFEISQRRYGTTYLERELASGARIASWVPAGATLFDGGRLPIERPRALPAPSLVLHVQQLIHTGRFPVDVGTELERRDVAWWRLDGRARAIENRLAEYRRENFLPVDGDLWAAGRVLVPAAGGAGFEIRVAADYWWRTASGAPLRLDGVPAPNPVRLADGPHRAEWDGAGPLVLSVVPLERWTPALEGRLRSAAHRRPGGL
jgi:4-amino-4-deoxy-L-arabinose transferase-like glycosyltransferase